MRPRRCRWCCCWHWCWHRLHLGRTNIDATIEDPQKSRAALIHPQPWITRVDYRATKCGQMGEGGTAVILQRTEPGVRVDLIASGGQITTAIITAQIVAERNHRGRPVGASLVINIPSGRTSIENRASNCQKGVADGGAVVNARALIEGGVAAKSAVDDRERRVIRDGAA